MEKLLMDAEVICHPLIIGELACGSMVILKMNNFTKPIQ